jgi:hypothetical protein
MVYVIILVLLVGVIVLVSAPLRRRPVPSELHQDEVESLERIDLEAARDAKYREIRDAELDHQTGKLSDDDYEAIDSTLRAEAIDLLHELDELDERGQGASESASAESPSAESGT